MSTENQTNEDLETIVLNGPSSKATLAPKRGGMLIRLDVGGRSLLYLDEATLRDPKQNVRGGAPVLFPSPGKLTSDSWARNGESGTMKQHGFARNLAWKTLSSTGSDGELTSQTLDIESNDETRAHYPWDFAVELTYSLIDRGVRIDQRVENRSTTPMPFGFGFHPYFFVADADKGTARIPTTATRAFDNTTKHEIDVPKNGIDLTAKEVDLHLMDHGRSSAELVLSEGRGVRLTASEDYRRWVIWTLAGKDFVCVEPWTCPGDALNTGLGLIDLAPGEARSLWLEIAALG